MTENPWADHKLPVTAATLAGASAVMWARLWAVDSGLATEPKGKHAQ